MAGPPASLKYFLPQSGQKGEKFAGLIINETYQENRDRFKIA
jgi:hypothetical protein